MSSFLSSIAGPAARVVVRFADADSRATVNVRQPDGRDEEQYLFGADDNITGTVEVDVSGSKKLEHMGVKVELIGLIELLQDRSNTYEFKMFLFKLNKPTLNLMMNQNEYDFYLKRRSRYSHECLHLQEAASIQG